MKEQANRGVNLSPMLMRRRKHSRGLNTNCKMRKRSVWGGKVKACEVALKHSTDPHILHACLLEKRMVITAKGTVPCIIRDA